MKYLIEPKQYDICGAPEEAVIVARAPEIMQGIAMPRSLFKDESLAGGGFVVMIAGPDFLWRQLWPFPPGMPPEMQAQILQQDEVNTVMLERQQEAGALEMGLRDLGLQLNQALEAVQQNLHDQEAAWPHVLALCTMHQEISRTQEAIQELRQPPQQQRPPLDRPSGLIL